MNNKNTNKKSIFSVISFLALLIGVILIISSIIYVDKAKNKETEKAPEKVYVDNSNNEVLENFSKQDAVDSMKDVLVSLGKDIEGKNRSVEERLKALNNADTDMNDVLNKETIDKLNLHEEFKEQKFNRQFVSSALLTYLKLIQESTGKKEIEASELGVEELIYLDPNLKVAYIPIDIFTGENRGVAFEMNYIDGDWKFTPYTSMMSLIMMVNYEERFANMQQENKK